MKKTRAKKFKVRMFYHLQNLSWGALSRGLLAWGVYVRGFMSGGFCPVTRNIILQKGCNLLFKCMHHRRTVEWERGLLEWWMLENKITYLSSNLVLMFVGDT